MKNPIKDCPPDDVLAVIQLSMRLQPDGSWLLVCPQWKYLVQTQNFTRTVACLLAEIEAHNDGDQGAFDWPKFAKQQGIVLLRPEHHPKPPEKRYGKQSPKLA